MIEKIKSIEFWNFTFPFSIPLIIINIYQFIIYNIYLETCKTGRNLWQKEFEVPSEFDIVLALIFP